MSKKQIKLKFFVNIVREHLKFLLFFTQAALCIFIFVLFIFCVLSAVFNITILLSLIWYIENKVVFYKSYLKPIQKRY